MPQPGPQGGFSPLSGLLVGAGLPPLRGTPPPPTAPGSAQTPSVVVALLGSPPGFPGRLRLRRPLCFYRHCAAAAAWAGAPVGRVGSASFYFGLFSAPRPTLPPGGFGSAPPSFAGYHSVRLRRPRCRSGAASIRRRPLPRFWGRACRPSGGLRAPPAFGGRPLRGGGSPGTPRVGRPLFLPPPAPGSAPAACGQRAVCRFAPPGAIARTPQTLREGQRE